MDSGKKSKQKNKRLTIGYLTGTVDLGATAKKLNSSIIKASKKNDVNLFCFFGGVLRPFKNPIIHKIPADFFRFINDQNINGLIIWTTTLKEYGKPLEIQKYISDTLSIPVITLGTALEDAPTIEIDNKQGIREAMKHLIEFHGYRKIGFIKADNKHKYSIDRLNAYLDSLKEYNIPVNNNLITPFGDWSDETGRNAAKIFFDDRKLKNPKQI